jgi:hypothetical protein
MNRLAPRLAFALAAAALLAACGASNTRAERDAQRLDELRAVAGEPVRDFRYTRLQGWNTFGDETVLVETSLREGWLLTVHAPCIDLPFAQSIGLSSGPGNTVSTFDYVMVGNDRCRIREIRPVDLRALRAARVESAEAAVSR